MASSGRRRKSALYGGLAATVKAIANVHRLELLDLLAQAPRTVDVLATMTDLSVANASQHLQVLRAAGLVSASREGPFVRYAIAGDDVAAALVSLRTLAQAHDDALDRAAAALRAGDGDAEVDRAALLARAERGELLFLDVRPAEEFAAAHLPHAISIPVKELKKRLAELPQHKRVVAYCRGPYCVFASDAVELLRAAGFEASSLSDGVAEWRARGLPLAPQERAS